MNPNQSPEKPHYPWNDTIRTVLVALVLALTFRSLAFEPFHIPSGSMKSNLLIGDYLFVSKFSYGYSRYSFPFGFHIYDGRKLEFHKPERGDVVVFRLPSNPRVDFIKRVMGLPGDSIQVRDGIVYINGSPLPRKKIDEWGDEDPETGQTVSIGRFEEVLPEGKKITILKQHRYGAADNTPIFVVPQGKYFMMGDNRDNSRDSRFEEVGFVPEENIVGKAAVIFFSMSDKASLTDPLSWFSSLRFRRFLSHIS